MVTISRGGIACIAAALALAAALAFVFDAGTPEAEAVIGGIGNVTGASNPHNFAAGSTGVEASTEDEICIFCHTPHTAIKNAGALDPPIWNHTLSEETYTLKSQSSTYSNSVTGDLILLTQPLQPDGASRLCLSCHDGTVSVGSLNSRESDVAMQDTCMSGGSEVSGLSSGVITSSCDAYIGTDLRNKHVVSVPMNAGLLTSSLINCSAPTSQTTRLKYPWQTGNAGDARPGTVLLRPTLAEYDSTPGIDLTGAQSAGLSTPYDRKYKEGYYYGVQCSTCHDPHLWTSTGNQNIAGYKFLVEPFNDLCQACHTDAGCPP